jgi:hypothetical protein
MKGTKYFVGVIALLMVMTTFVQASPDTTLTPAEQVGLIYMRQSEKLEYDIYLDLADTWDIPIFNNIANNEQNHMDSILGLLNKYGLSDPVAGLEPGDFQDPVLARRYRSSVTQGEVSLVYALSVAAETEEMSIGDIMLRMTQSNKRDIKNVYNNLRLDSANHLRAFVAELSRNGITYRPQHLAPALYKIIVYGYGNGRHMHRIPSGM